MFAGTYYSANLVMEKMSDGEKFTYISGVVEGLAYGRYLKDGKTLEGMTCIHNWFYAGGNRQEQIVLAFEEFGDKHSPGVIIWSMTREECGE